MQIKYHYIPTRIAKIKKIDKPVVGTGAEQLEHCWWECKNIQVLWKTVCYFLKNLNTRLVYVSAVPLLGTKQREMKTCPHKDLHADVHSSPKLETTQMLFHK